jgi:hypothetical protein
VIQQLLDATRTVQQRILGVEVKVDEGGHCFEFKVQSSKFKVRVLSWKTSKTDSFLNFEL